MKPAANPNVAQALLELDNVVDAELAAIEALCSLGMRAAKAPGSPVDAAALLALLEVVASKVEMLRNDAGCLIDMARKAAGLEVRP